MIQSVTNIQKLAYSVEETAKQLGVSKSTIRGRIRDGQLKAKKFGQRVLILDTDLQEFLNNQPDWQDWKEENQK